MIIWIAGWPKCGTTLCRQIIEQCFELPTFSKYDEPPLDDLFKSAAAFIEDLRKDPAGRFEYYREAQELYLIKTHEIPDHASRDDRFIYCCRDGRDAVVSLARFWHVRITNIIVGQNVGFGCWSGHYYAWNPVVDDINSVIVRFDDMIMTPDMAAAQLQPIIGFPVKRKFENQYDKLVPTWPHFFKKPPGGLWREQMTEKEKRIFWLIHHNAMNDLKFNDNQKTDFV
jgi:hypothetical protein